MSVEEVYEVLKNKKKKWLSAKDIERIIHLRQSNIDMNLKRLVKRKEVKFKEEVRVVDNYWQVRPIMVYKIR